MKKHIPLLKQTIVFGIVGVMTLGIDVGVTALLYVVFHLPAYLASAIGFLSGFFFNFPMNRKKVFHHSTNDRFSLKTQIMLYWILVVFNLIATSAMVELIVHMGATILVAKVVVTAIIAVWNFVIFKLYIFSKLKNDREPLRD